MNDGGERRGARCQDGCRRDFGVVRTGSEQDGGAKRRWAHNSFHAVSCSVQPPAFQCPDSFATHATMFSLLVASLFAAAPVTLPPMSESFYRAQVQFLSHDLLEGRGPATRGDELARAYIAAQFLALGLEPLGELGSFFQPVPLMSIEGHPAAVAFAGAKGKITAKHGVDLVTVAAGPRTEAAWKNAELVFVGYGIDAPALGWNDYKDVDVRGKVVVILNNDPETEKFGGKARLWFGRWDYKYLTADKHGALGALIVHTIPSAGYPWQVVQTSWGGAQFELEGDAAKSLQAKGWFTDKLAREVMSAGGQSFDELLTKAESAEFQPVPLGVKASMAMKSKVSKTQSANVLARLKGKTDETVVYTAHHDHLGRGAKNAAGDDIYNGAVDNASGVAALLSVAKAFSEQRASLNRSVVFAAVAGEEQGLLGSRYLASHLPMPAGKIWANVNMDAENMRGRTADVEAVGWGKSSLDKVLQACAAQQKRTVKPDQQADKGSFYRSDQFNFARIGVPAAYFGSGLEYIGRPEGWGKAENDKFTAQHYHQPSDQYDSAWELSGAIEDAQLYYCVGASVLSEATAPVWNAGDEFEAIGKAR